VREPALPLRLAEPLEEEGEEALLARLPLRLECLLLLPLLLLEPEPLLLRARCRCRFRRSA
jgi:hypothetical protein